MSRTRLAPTLLLLAAGALAATETEHHGLRILPPPGPVAIDGDIRDWDLSGGVLACGDVENQRDKYGVWIHAMWDEKNLYLLARWNDLTPMNHPGSIKGDYGFNGDSLQFRVVTGTPEQLKQYAGGADLRQVDDLPGSRVSHLTAWRDREGLDTLQIGWGHRFNEGGCEARNEGGAQAFKVRADRRGYLQELSVPWAKLSRDGWKPQAGGRVICTVEPNFLTGAGTRLTIKDIFRENAAIDRVFTFGNTACWGWGTLEAKGGLAPRPVRLSDGREFAVRLADGVPTPDWTGLVKSREPEGFKPIRFSVEEDGYVSMNIFRADGTVARQLLTCAFYPKGEHEVRWDGLGTMSIRVPGQPVAAGDYTWGGIWHPGATLTLRGWAGSTSATPWGNVWGADHGDPCAVAADGEQVYVGWSGGEGTKPLLACTPDGRIQWKQIRGGIASASLVAVDAGTVYVWNEFGQYAPRSLYRVHAKDGSYSVWTRSKGTDLAMHEIFPEEAKLDAANRAAAEKQGKEALAALKPRVPNAPNSICAGGGRVFLGFGDRSEVVVVDGASGEVVRRLAVPAVGDIELGADGRLLAVSWSDSVCRVVAVDVATGAATTVGTVPLTGKDWPRAIAVDRDGEIYCGITGSEGRHYVQVLGRDGKPTRTIGRPSGRRLSGPWDREGMFQISALAVDAKGQLWATEQDGQPRRTSVWNAKTGAFVAEYFGASTYGALGAAIDPLDPGLMCGQGCEWRIDAKTGVAMPIGTIDRKGMMASRYALGANGHVYLATTNGFLSAGHQIRIHEKISDGVWKLRTTLTPQGKDKEKTIAVWADANDDQQEQPEEVKTYPDELGGWIQGWYMAVTPDLTCYGGRKQVKVTGWTACGAPVYDLSQAKPLPAPKDGQYRGGMGAQWNAGSADNRFVLWNGSYGDDHATLDCFDIASGKLMWSYPSNFTGVHGSHRACAPEVGMLRGAYDICGSVTLPPPIGNIWVIPTNKGEWHAVTEQGYYLTKFWEGDGMKVELPGQAVPGVDCTRCPPGAGEEAFGGSISLSKAGEFSLQGGHTSFWNVKVSGLEKAKALAGGKLSLSAEDVATAAQYRSRQLAMQEGDRKLTIVRATPAFSGDLAKDFPAAAGKAFARQDNAKIRTALAWDDANLYAGWQVQDDTPWVNGADAPEFMYARGDTVDLQLQTDAKAPAGRKEAGTGDLRLSLGAFQGKPTAVIYRRVAGGAERKPIAFNSGVYKNYIMESVLFPSDIRISVKPAEDKKGYTVEAVIPWTVLGMKPEAGLVLRGDLGATHGNKAGNDTVLRSYWSNFSTGLVSDEVEELMLVPGAWGEFAFGR